MLAVILLSCGVGVGPCIERSGGSYVGGRGSVVLGAEGQAIAAKQVDAPAFQLVESVTARKRPSGATEPPVTKDSKAEDEGMEEEDEKGRRTRMRTCAARKRHTPRTSIVFRLISPWTRYWSKQKTETAK